MMLWTEYESGLQLLDTTHNCSFGGNMGLGCLGSPEQRSTDDMTKKKTQPIRGILKQGTPALSYIGFSYSAHSLAMQSCKPRGNHMKFMSFSLLLGKKHYNFTPILECNSFLY
jgi:hypothetical protein